MRTLALLDDLGVSEQAYGPEAHRFDGFGLQLGPWFRARLAMPTVHGRTCEYSILRPRVDQVLWPNLERYPSVSRPARCRRA